MRCARSPWPSRSTRTGVYPRRLASGRRHGRGSIGLLRAHEGARAVLRDDLATDENTAGAARRLAAISELAVLLLPSRGPPPLGVCLDSCPPVRLGLRRTDPAALDAGLDELDARRPRPPGAPARQRLGPPLGSNRGSARQHRVGPARKKLESSSESAATGTPAVLEVAGKTATARRGRDQEVKKLPARATRGLRVRLDLREDPEGLSPPGAPRTPGSSPARHRALRSTTRLDLAHRQRPRLARHGSEPVAFLRLQQSTGRSRPRKPLHHPTFADPAPRTSRVWAGPSGRTPMGTDLVAVDVQQRLHSTSSVVEREWLDLASSRSI